MDDAIDKQIDVVNSIDAVLKVTTCKDKIKILDRAWLEAVNCLNTLIDIRYDNQ